MPEGDTIHRTANRLRPALEDKELVRFSAPRLVGDVPKPGEVITAVEAIGKNLLVRFPKHLVLHTHMKMTGSWHLYRTHEKWQEPAHLARAEIEVQDWVAVCFSAPTVRTWRDVPGTPSPLSHLGPDLCLPDADVDIVLDRIATFAEPGTPIAEVLLDQRVAAGIGNVYKSEALWVCRVSPFAPIESVSEITRRKLYETAGRQLRANLTTVSRVTVGNGLGVYGRQRQPCLRCRTPIKTVAHGDQARTSYWCPRCQPDA